MRSNTFHCSFPLKEKKKEKENKEKVQRKQQS